MADAAERDKGPDGRLIRVVIADDHPMVRDGTRTYLEQAHDLTVVGVADGGIPALKLVRQIRPDVLLLDLHLPDLSGLEVVRRIRAERLETAILVLTGYDEVGYIRPLIELGVQGYLSKTASAEKIVVAVRGSVAGHRIFDLATTQIARHELPEPLTARELEVLQLIAVGQRNREIAATLSLSLTTVEFHISHILAKLGARSRTEAVHIARKVGLLY